MYLDETLSRQDAFLSLYNFAKNEFNHENLEFLQLVRKLNPRLGVAAVDYFPSYAYSTLHKTQYIFKYYVQTDAKKQINLPSGIFNDLKMGKACGTLNQTSFDQAYASIHDLVDRDFWTRYVATAEGRRWHAEINNAWQRRAAAPVVAAPAVIAAPPLAAANVIPAAPPNAGFRRPVLPVHNAPINVNRGVPRPPLPPLPALPPGAAAAEMRRRAAMREPLPQPGRPRSGAVHQP